MVSWELVFAIIPGIILFLYGIEQFSREVQLAAGEYLRGSIQQLTQTPLRGTAAGAVRNINFGPDRISTEPALDTPAWCFTGGER